MVRVIVSIFFLVTVSALNAQKYFSGIVVDQKEQPIPFAHIQLKGSSVGTITNSEGMFAIYIPKNQASINHVLISSIGYVSKEMMVTERFEKIILQEDIIQLAEIAVIPIDYALEIVEKAIANIPKNYPQTEERHTGFVREHAYWDSLKTQPVYIVESVVESHKKSYNQKVKSGTVKLIEGRKYESNELDSLRARFYGGTHDAHEFDIVARRSSFLDKPSKYALEIVDTLRYDSKDVFKIAFSKEKNSFGHVLIVDSSFAILKAEFVSTDFSGLIEGRSRKFQKFTVNYIEDAKWRLNSVYYKTAFQMGERILYLFSEYATTEINPNHRPIPYIERFQYEDIFLENAGVYDSIFWKNYNIILPDANTEEFFKSQPTPAPEEEKQIERRRFTDIVKRFRSSIAVNYIPMQIRNYTINFSNSEFSINESANTINTRTISLASSIQYELRNSLFIGMTSAFTLTDPSNSLLDIQVLKEININPKGRPILLSPGIALGYQQNAKKIGSFESDSNYRINGRKFDSGNTDISLQQERLRAFPSLTLGIEKSHRLQYFISAGYNISINEKTGLYFDETDQFFLKQKSAFLENGKEGLNITYDGTLFENRWVFSLGLYLSF